MVERIKVNGIAVKPGVSRNNVMYSKEELKKFAPTLKGVSIIKDHNASCDNAIGKVENITFDEMSGNVLYEGWVENDSTNISEKIKDGRVQHVSIGALAGKMVKESEDSEYSIAEDLTGVELSTVIVPGVPGASIQHAFDDYTEEDVKKLITDYTLEQASAQTYTNERRLNKMENTNEKIVQETKSTEFLAMESKLKATEETLKVCEEKLKSAESKLAEIAEAQRLDNAKSYAEMAKSKGLNAVDTSKLTIEMIKTLMEAIKDVKVEAVKEEVKVKEAVKEEVKTTEVKETATPKSAVVTEAKAEVKEKSNYVIEQSSLGGSCLYKL